MSLTALAFAGANFALLVLAFARHPIFGLFAYLLAFYDDPGSRWWGQSLPDLRWSLLAATVAIAATLRRGVRERRTGLESTPGRIMLAYALWMWVQCLFAADVAAAEAGAVLFTKYVVLIVLIERTVDTPERLGQFATAHVLGCFIFGWVAWRSPRLENGRLEGTGGPGIDDANTLALHLVTGLAFAGAKLVNGGWLARVGALGATAFILNTIILCQSRGSLIALLCSSVVMLVLVPDGMRRRVAVTLGIAAVLFAALSSHEFWERMRTIEQYDSEASASSRIELVEPSLRMFFDHPLGVGHDGFKALSGRYCPSALLDAKGQRSPHTTILAVLTEQGFPGVVLYLALMFALFRDVVRVRAEVCRRLDRPDLVVIVAAIGMSLAAFAVGGITGSYIKAEAQIWAIGLLSAVGIVVRRAPPAIEPVALDVFGRRRVPLALVPSTARPLAVGSAGGAPSPRAASAIT